MDGSDSNQPCKKRKSSKPNLKKKQCGSRVDKLSKLPDDIIVIALSFLSSREAAATSILSSRWTDLWKHTPNLNFFNLDGNLNLKTSEIEHTSWDVETCKHVQMVNSALQSHQALSLKQFRISFYINKSAHSAVTKWLQFVWSRQVERLELNFQCLMITHGVVLEELLGEMRPMKYLKRLCLISMKASGEDISLFLSNCPLLRELIVRCSSLTSDVDVCGATLVLEHLQIRRCITGSSIINISAPNLTSVKLDPRRWKLLFQNVPRLAMANFGIESPTYTVHHFAHAVSSCTSQLQKLILTLLYPKKFLMEGFPQMPNLKELVVIDSAAVYEHGCLLPVRDVISACPRLQKFTFRFLAKVKDATPDVERICPHQHLQMLMFRGSGASHIIQLVTSISDHFVALQKIDTCSPLMSKAEVKAHRNHLKLLKAQLSHYVLLKFFELT